MAAAVSIAGTGSRYRETRRPSLEVAPTTLSQRKKFIIRWPWTLIY